MIDSDDWQDVMRAVQAFVRRRVGDPGVAEDLAQEALARGVAREGVRPDLRARRAFCLRAARNLVVDHLRQRARQPRHETGEPVAAQLTASADDAPLLRSLRDFVHALPPEQREAVWLTECEGVSQSELAARLGLPLSTVKSRVQRGRRRVEQALHDCCSFELDRRGGVVDWHRRVEARCRGGACCDP